MNIIKLIRVKHWSKNALIFLPWLMGAQYPAVELFWGIISCLTFSFLASAGYVFNDLQDIEKDRLHPYKKFRPLASGVVSKSMAIFLIILLILLPISSIIWLEKKAVLMLVIYLIWTVFYSRWFKKIRILDLMVLTGFYLIRIYFGAFALGVTLTGWFVATLTMAFLSLSVNKRYMELKLTVSQELAGRDYSNNDIGLLRVIMISTAMVSVVMLNIHAFLILEIKDALFYAFLNVIAVGILLFYFDENKIKSDDPVERVLNNKWLLFMVLLLLVLYIWSIKAHGLL